VIVYLASPASQIQADAARDMPVLVSFGCWKDWLDKYQASFRRLLIDSGAFSELNSGKVIDLEAYKDWSARWIGHADAIAGLDDIRGDWRKGLRNLEAIPWSFPTWHDSDPLELVTDLVAMARERRTWLGIGLVPPREGKERVIREALELAGGAVHVHGWALRRYTHIRRLDSVDSTNWWRDAMKLRTLPDTKHLTYGECLEVVVKRYSRWTREVIDEQPSLLALHGSGVATHGPT
jgi:hypothetical protein